MVFTHSKSGRSARNFAILIGIWILLIFACFKIGAHPVILVLVFLGTLPALWDLINNRLAGIALSDTNLSWHSGQTKNSIAHQDIDHIRLNRRLDLTYRVEIRTLKGQKLRLPPDAVPPIEAFEEALRKVDIRTERHPFSLL